MEENATYVDEEGNRIDPSAVGNTHEVIGEKKPQQQTSMGKMMQEQRVSNFISQTSPSQTLNNINYILRGYVYDSEEREWKNISDGVPNQVRLDFLQFITPDLSEDVRMTNLSSDQINGIMEFVIEWVVDYLDIVADEHKLSEEQMTKIALIMIKAVYYTILRAQNGIERKEMFGSLKMGEVLGSPPQQNQNQNWWKFWR